MSTFPEHAGMRKLNLYGGLKRIHKGHYSYGFLGLEPLGPRVLSEPKAPRSEAVANFGTNSPAFFQHQPAPQWDGLLFFWALATSGIQELPMLRS